MRKSEVKRYRITDSLAFEYKMKKGKGEQSIYCQENILVIANTLFQKHSTHVHHHMVNTEIRLIMFFVAKDG